MTFFSPIKLMYYVEGKEWLNPSRKKNEGTHRRKKVDRKSCVTFLLCMYVCIFIKLHITAQSGPVIRVILCHSH